MTLRNRYPDADILAQRAHWDDATREVILDRVHNVPSFRYFDLEQRVTLEALCARVIPQDHRPLDRKVPIAPWIDARCERGVIDGFRFEDMPPNEVAWTWGLEGLDQSAQALFGCRFTGLEGDGQDQVLRAIGGGDPPGEVWQRLPARRWWIHTALRQITGTYYAHPYAWDEIGFGGPAYPRGYASLNFGAPEPWEPREVPTEMPAPVAMPVPAFGKPTARPAAPSLMAPATREPQRAPVDVETPLPTPRWRRRTPSQWTARPEEGSASGTPSKQMPEKGTQALSAASQATQTRRSSSAPSQEMQEREQEGRRPSAPSQETQEREQEGQATSAPSRSKQRETER